jgi:ribose 1,5-bisphosphokinase PhnN
VVANVSRGVIAKAAAASGRVWVLEVTAPADVLASRLAARGRETAEDVARRLARTMVIPDGVPVTTIRNDGTLEEGIARFVAALRVVIAEAARA